MNLYIKVGSITNAQRGQRLLRAKGYKSQIKKIENPVKTDGCGYVLAVVSDDKKPVEILQQGRIGVRGVEVQ